MPGTFSDSWKLTKTSFRLITEDRALLVFPLVAGLSTLGVVALLVLGEYWFISPSFPGGHGGSAATSILEVMLFLIAYLAMAFLSVYCTAALVGAATLKLNGQQPRAADGWKVARSRLARLTIWAIITATVGLAIQVISSRTRGVAGALIGIVGGVSWGIVTYFMIPVLLYEDAKPWPALRRSAHLFTSTFGRSLVTNLVLGLIIGAGFFAAVVMGIVGIVLWVTSSTPLLGVGLVGGAIALAVIVLLIGATAEGILRAALYRFATTGKVDRDLVPAAYLGARPAAESGPLF